MCYGLVPRVALLGGSGTLKSGALGGKGIKENDGRCEFNWSIVKTFVNVTMLTQYNNKKFFKSNVHNKGCNKFQQYCFHKEIRNQ
jgi:hypothetical protein